MAGQRLRTAIVWDENTAYSSYATQPSADLDLLISVPNGSVVVQSVSWDNSYEIVDSTPNTTGIYTISVRRGRCDLTPRWPGWAWWRGAAPTPPTRRLTVTNTNVAGGTIASSPGGITCGTTCAFDYEQNRIVTLGPTPHSGYQFTEWAGACAGVTASCAITMDVARSVSGGFVAVNCSPTARPSARRASP